MRARAHIHTVNARIAWVAAIQTSQTDPKPVLTVTRWRLLVVNFRRLLVLFCFSGVNCIVVNCLVGICPVVNCPVLDIVRWGSVLLDIVRWGSVLLGIGRWGSVLLAIVRWESVLLGSVLLETVQWGPVLLGTVR